MIAVTDVHGRTYESRRFLDVLDLTTMAMEALAEAKSSKNLKLVSNIES